MSAKSAKTNSVRSEGGSLRNSLHDKLHSQGSGEERVMLAADESKDRLYEPKRDKKMVRVLTVVVYVFCVSLAAIMLSLYYVFFWVPKGPHYVKPKVFDLTAHAHARTRPPCVPAGDIAVKTTAVTTQDTSLPPDVSLSSDTPPSSDMSPAPDVSTPSVGESTHNETEGNTISGATEITRAPDPWEAT